MKLQFCNHDRADLTLVDNVEVIADFACRDAASCLVSRDKPLHEPDKNEMR